MRKVLVLLVLLGGCAKAKPKVEALGEVNAQVDGEALFFWFSLLDKDLKQVAADGVASWTYLEGDTLLCQGETAFEAKEFSEGIVGAQSASPRKVLSYQSPIVLIDECGGRSKERLGDTVVPRNVSFLLTVKVGDNRWTAEDHLRY